MLRRRNLIPLMNWLTAPVRGLLRFGSYHGAHAWFTLDASHRNGCVRRMDGATLSHTGAKSLIFRGALAQWPVGIGEAQPFPVVLNRAADCQIAPAALPMFTGKRVRIFAHDDAAGYAFAFAGVRTRDGGTADDLNGFAHVEANDENERLLANLRL